MNGDKMTILYEKKWKNEVNNKRKVCIGLINRLFIMVSEKNKEDINLRYEYIINYLGNKKKKRFKNG